MREKLLTQSPQKQPPHVSAVTPRKMEVRSPPVFKSKAAQTKFDLDLRCLPSFSFDATSDMEKCPT